MTSSGSSFLRQLSGREGWKSTSRRWRSAATDNGLNSNRGYYDGGCERSLKQMEGLNNVMYGSGSGGMVVRKRVMVVVDASSHSKHAMMWALTHVTNKGDLLTLLHVIPPSPLTTNSQPGERGSDHQCCSNNSPNYLATSLASLCKACKPEVDVEALVVQGPKLATVMSQVKKLEVSVLVLGQKKPSPLLNCLCGSSSTEKFVEQCINNVECLTIGVRKQRKGIGGYLISTRWQKNFWLLA
ncbi:hypothetical protein RHSIM_Rhsim06G0104500 [Rhododendron simsii]|uniref:UspA domain-containing protein n=1 Tax=Rhododendron simsii TaxID=118357 RepID=A0A834GWT2_RHOSS|nr:hypothetical protein RHSIM_Rhsim06G0104500 [Rhododendron simsii]